MIERVYAKEDKLTQLTYQKYLTDLGIETEYFKGICPTCKDLFKIKPLPFEKVDGETKYPAIHCPYCGHHDYYHNFFINDKPTLELDTTRICRCGLTYSITGVTVICPNCIIFNSRQLFLEQIDKIKTSIAGNGDWENLSDNLAKLVSQFDGYGRATIRFQYFTSVIPTSVKSISFQNLEGANRNIEKEFQIKIKDFVTRGEWDLVFKYFQRRHVIAHSLGVTDQEYIDKTRDTSVRVGQRIPLDANEIILVAEISTKLGLSIYAHLAS